MSIIIKEKVKTNSDNFYIRCAFQKRPGGYAGPEADELPHAHRGVRAEPGVHAAAERVGGQDHGPARVRTGPRNPGKS